MVDPGLGVADGVAQSVLHRVGLGVRLDVSASRMASAFAIPVPVHTLATVVPIATVLVGGAHAQDPTTLLAALYGNRRTVMGEQRTPPAGLKPGSTDRHGRDEVMVVGSG